MRVDSMIGSIRQKLLLILGGSNKYSNAWHLVFSSVCCYCILYVEYSSTFKPIGFERYKNPSSHPNGCFRLWKKNFKIVSLFWGKWLRSAYQKSTGICDKVVPIFSTKNYRKSTIIRALLRIVFLYKSYKVNRWLSRTLS